MSDPSDGVLLENFRTAFAAIDLLCAHHMIQPALVLIYSTMDAAAWLDVEGQGDVTRQDFVRWVDRYVVPKSALNCSSLELYGARCGILHSFTAFSKLSRSGKARSLSYASGVATVTQVDQVSSTLDRTGHVSVHLDHLNMALQAGMQNFINEAHVSAERWKRIRQRASMLYSVLPHWGTDGIIVVLNDKHSSQ